MNGPAKPTPIRGEQEDLLKQFERSLQMNFDALMRNVKDKETPGDSEDEESDTDEVAAGDLEPSEDDGSDLEDHGGAAKAAVGSPQVKGKVPAPLVSAKAGAKAPVKTMARPEVTSESQLSSERDLNHGNDMVSKYSDGDSESGGSVSRSKLMPKSSNGFAKDGKGKPIYGKKVNLSGKIQAMKSEVTKTQEDRLPNNSQRSGQPKTVPSGPKASPAQLPKAMQRKPSAEKQSFTPKPTPVKTVPNPPSRSTDRTAQRSVDVNKARNQRPTPATAPKKEALDTNVAPSLDSDSQMKESNQISASQQSLGGVRLADKRVVQSNQELAGRSLPRNRLSVNGATVEGRAKDSAGFSISSKKNLASSSTNFARNTPKPASPRPGSAHSRSRVGNSMVSSQARVPAVPKNDPELKQKYEKMRQANKLLQDNLNQLVLKHQKLLDLFQKLQRENAAQKQLIDRLQEERQAARVTRAAPPVASQKDLPKKSAQKGSFRRI